MKRLQVLFGLIAVLATAFGKPSGDCEGPVFKVNGVNYIREHINIKKNIKSPEFLSYDRKTNSIFMKYQTDDSMLGGNMNLNYNKFATLDGFTHVGTTAVDAKTDKVYIHLNGGIYKYENRCNLYFAINDTFAPYINMLFAKSDIVYVTTLPAWMLYKIENGQLTRFKEFENTKVMFLVIDDNDNMYFANDTGLYRQKIGSEEAVHYKNSEGLPIEGISINNADDVYAFAGSSGIYAVGKNTNEIEKVLDVTAHGLTFDGDNNMIYADYNELYRLKLNNDSNCV